MKLKQALLRRWVRGVLGVLAVVAVVTAWLGAEIRADLQSDFVQGGSRADRWWPLTWPVLHICAGSQRPQRRTFADRALLAAPWPWGEQWLEQRLQENASSTFPYYEGLPPPLVASMHLTDPVVFQRCIDIAINGLRTGEVGNQYNVGFLRAAESYRSETAATCLSEAEHCGHSKAVAIVRALGPPPDRYEARCQALAARLFQPPPKESSSGLDHDADSPVFDTILAAERYPHLKKRVRYWADHDLKALYSVPGMYLDEVVEWFPNSRLGRGCLAYSRIRGQDYCDPHSDADVPHRPFPPAEEYRRWAEWLKTYPEHPGADDASYWMGRCLEWQGRRVEALWHYVDMLEHMPGDGDMTQPTRERVASLLNVAASDDEIEAMRTGHPAHALAPALLYALAVRRARHQRFDDALRLTANLAWPAIAHAWNFDGRVGEDDSGGQPADYSTISLYGTDGYITQRHGWQDMAQVAHRHSVLDLARAWAGEDAWKACYCMLDSGWYHQDILDDPYNTVIRDGYRHANAHAIAWELLQRVPVDTADLDLQVTLLKIDQLDAIGAYSTTERYAMIPLPGCPALAKSVDDYDWASKWYEVQADRLYHDVMIRYPASRRPASGRSLWSDVTSLYQDWRSQPSVP